MSASLIAEMAVAGAAVLGSIGSVLVLAIRIGRLIGSVEAFIKSSEADRSHLWETLGVLTKRFDRHVEQHSSNTRGVTR